MIVVTDLAMPGAIILCKVSDSGTSCRMSADSRARASSAENRREYQA